MPRSLQVPTLRIPVEPLDNVAFSPFGYVIENPNGINGFRPPSFDSARTAPIEVNQGTGIKYGDVSPIINDYSLAPSRRAAKPTMSFFVCRPRELHSIASASSVGTVDDHSVAKSSIRKSRFDVKILERHLYTTQTFIPLGLSASASTRYLVIVAPSQTKPGYNKEAARPPPFPSRLPRRRRSLLDIFSKARPSAFTNNNLPPTSKSETTALSRKGKGLPDVTKLRAFLATGNQAITYAAGTWHGPMAVVGTEPVEFVVLQHSNGVAEEDCEEVELVQEPGADDGVSVILDFADWTALIKAKL